MQSRRENYIRLGKIIRGSRIGQDLRFAVVVAFFNEQITSKLLEGCIDGLVENGVKRDFITVVSVPGSLELGVVAKKMAGSYKYDAVICLGSVIRGETSHYDIVANWGAYSMTQAALDTGIPVILGYLTTENEEQAEARSGGSLGNKGYDAALTGIEMANLMKTLGNTER